MKPLFKCELSYFPHTHLSPLYAGFELLKKNGIIDISLMPYKGDTRIPLLKLKIDNKYTVIYDTLDGFNWINGSIQENLNHFKANTKADFYFKRGFSKDIVVYTPSNCRVYPLGFNYPIKTIDWPPKEMKEILKEFIKSNYFTSRCLKISKNSFYSKYFEHYPLASRENQILYVVSLKNPEEATLEHLKIERETLNAKRIEYIRFCKKEFGERFIGGLVKDDFSSKNNADLLMSYSLTKRNFI